MKIAIVGNGPIDTRFFDHIETADFIIRFNSPPRAHEYAGMRTDRLVISNSSKQTQGLLTSHSYLEGPVFAGADSVLLPYHPDMIRQFMPKPNFFSWLKGRRADLTELCERVAQARGKSVAILEKSTYLEACEQLGIIPSRRCVAFPSSGMLTIFHSLKSSRDADLRLQLFGFGFAGWKGHDWSAERIYVEGLISQGKIFLVT